MVLALWQPFLLRGAGITSGPRLQNAVLSVTFQETNGTLAVLDKRTGRTWEQQSLGFGLSVLGFEVTDRITATLRHPALARDVRAVFELDPALPEMTVTLEGNGLLAKPLAYPHPFATARGMELLVPINGGISYPVDDPAISSMWLEMSLLSMSFCAATDGERSCMMIIETPDDAAIHITRMTGNFTAAPAWSDQKGRFGYPRRVRYVFLDRGGHVAVCKRYRELVRERGLLRTLHEKRARSPDVDRLVGAMDVWCWDKEALPIARDMKSRGMDRILWSTVIFGPNEYSPETIRGLNGMGFLTARYDNYQETMDPALFGVVEEQATWVTEAWPHDRLLGAGGERPKTWWVMGRDGKRYGCVVVCDRQALKYARKRIEKQLETLPYRARFVDTTTAARWRECHDPAHPMTQGACHRFRLELLRYVSEGMNLVTGSENGRETAVPYAHYFEGMMSLQPYRIPEEYRKPFDIWRDPLPESVRIFQLGTRYRLPLWELVFHDCIVSHWWWGDCNSSAPAARALRDLWNILYGTPPMIHVFPTTWERDKRDLVETYHRVCPVARAVGYAEMKDHRFLVADRSVQSTEFSNGLRVTVNFGEKPFILPQGGELAPGGFMIGGMDRGGSDAF